MKKQSLSIFNWFTPSPTTSSSDNELYKHMSEEQKLIYEETERDLDEVNLRLILIKV